MTGVEMDYWTTNFLKNFLSVYFEEITKFNCL